MIGEAGECTVLEFLEVLGLILPPEVSQKIESKNKEIEKKSNKIQRKQKKEKRVFFSKKSRKTKNKKKSKKNEKSKKRSKIIHKNKNRKIQRLKKMIFLQEVLQEIVQQSRPKKHILSTREKEKMKKEKKNLNPEAYRSHSDLQASYLLVHIVSKRGCASPSCLVSAMGSQTQHLEICVL